MTTKAHTTDTVEYMGRTYLTRYWYMDGRKVSIKYPEQDSMVAHRRYYGQFVTPGVRAMVLSAFSKARWAKMAKAFHEGDTHLNDCTTLADWDRLDSSTRGMVGRIVTNCAYAEFSPGCIYWSPSENTCITKEAARTIIETAGYPQ